MDQQPKKFTDEEIIAAIRQNNGNLTERVFSQLWNDAHLRGAIQMMASKYGQKEGVTMLDLLANSLGIFFEIVAVGKFKELQNKSLRDYIIGIAKWRAYTDYRSGERREDRHEKLVDLNEPDFFDPEEWLWSKEQKENIEKALTNFIGERCRKVIGLRDDGYSEQESAGMLNLTLSSLKDARKTCKKKWEAFVEHLRNNPGIRKSILGR